MWNSFCSTLCFMLCAAFSLAQTDSGKVTTPKLNEVRQSKSGIINTSHGQVSIHMNESLTRLMALRDSINREKECIDGYRVQIFFGSGAGSGTKAKEVKARFIKKYRNVPADKAYANPNHIVRVGTFRTQMQAQKFLEEVIIDFPSSYIVKDCIDLPKLD